MKRDQGSGIRDQGAQRYFTISFNMVDGKTRGASIELTGNVTCDREVILCTVQAALEILFRDAQESKNPQSAIRNMKSLPRVTG